jgi:hypothetical protein
LKVYRREEYELTEPVFAKGLPRARTLRIDLEKAGIPYQDEEGRYADFHSLRYTWGTFLQRNNVSQRIAMRLMRHSSIDLTSKLYTDESLLPIARTVDSLPSLDLEKCTQIRIQISVGEGQKLSGSGVNETSSGKLEVAILEELVGFCRNLAD